MRLSPGTLRDPRSSLVPRPRPAFRCLQYGKATESWAEPGYKATWEDSARDFEGMLIGKNALRHYVGGKAAAVSIVGTSWCDKNNDGEQLLRVWLH